MIIEYKKFANKSDNKFVDISSEMFRSYEWSDGYKLTVAYPHLLSVSKSGGHRIFDAEGISHYIQPGWRHLFWEVKEGEPNFVK